MLQYKTQGISRYHQSIFQNITYPWFSLKINFQNFRVLKQFLNALQYRVILFVCAQLCDYIIIIKQNNINFPSQCLCVLRGGKNTCSIGTP